MTSALSALVQKATYQKRHEPFCAKPLTVDLDEKPTGEHNYHFGCAVQDEFELKLTVKTTFWANPAQMDTRRIIATRVIANALYGSFSDRLYEAIHLIHNRDVDEAVKKISEVIGEMKGGR